VFVLDVDGEKGRASLARLEAKYGQLSATRASRTGREDGGEQWWFAYPADCAIRNSTGKLGEGLDIRGEGGYAIVPPSVHETGRTYLWINPDAPIADAPGWLKLLARSAEPVRDEGRIIPEGRRNTTLTSIAGRMRRAGASEDETRAELRIINERDCRPPLPDDQVCKIARSVARYDPAANRIRACRCMILFALRLTKMDWTLLAG
jgi:putative DNA primase/helicase